MLLVSPPDGATAGHRGIPDAVNVRRSENGAVCQAWAEGRPRFNASSREIAAPARAHTHGGQASRPHALCRAGLPSWARPCRRKPPWSRGLWRDSQMQIPSRASLRDGQAQRRSC